jgi:transaldolase/glucose-6-phosphate isomerase
MSLTATTDALLADGVELFADAFRGLLNAVDRQSRGTGAERIRRRCRRSVPPAFEAAIAESLAEWQAHGKVRRLWARDPTLWTGGDESKWLDWLDRQSPARGRAAIRATPR